MALFKASIYAYVAFFPTYVGGERDNTFEDTEEAHFADIHAHDQCSHHFLGKASKTCVKDATDGGVNYAITQCKKADGCAVKETAGTNSRSGKPCTRYSCVPIVPPPPQPVATGSASAASDVPPDYVEPAPMSPDNAPPAPLHNELSAPVSPDNVPPVLAAPNVPPEDVQPAPMSPDNAPPAPLDNELSAPVSPDNVPPVLAAPKKTEEECSRYIEGKASETCIASANKNDGYVMPAIAKCKEMGCAVKKTAGTGARGGKCTRHSCVPMNPAD